MDGNNEGLPQGGQRQQLALHGVDPHAVSIIDSLVDVPPEKFPYFDGPDNAVTAHTVKSSHQKTFKRKQKQLAPEHAGSVTWEELDDALHKRDKTNIARGGRCCSAHVPCRVITAAWP